MIWRRRRSRSAVRWSRSAILRLGGRDLGIEMGAAILDDRAVETLDLVESVADHVGQDHAGFGVQLGDVAEIWCVLLAERGAKLLQQIAVHDVVDVEGVDLAGEGVGLAFKLLVFGHHLKGGELLTQPH